VVGGNFFPNNLFASPTIVRLLPDGSPDGSFAPARTGPGRFTYFDTMEQQPDGKLLVAGSFLPPTGSTIRTVRRLESTGALDASFAGRAFMVASASNNFLSLAVQTDGKVLVAGRFSAYDGAPRTNVARLNSDGTNDAAFLPPSITGTVSELLLQPNGRVLVGGLFTGTGLPDNLARLLPNGQADASFGATAVPDSTVSALLVQPDGKIVLGGAFTTVGNQPAVAVARLTVANVLLATLPQAVADRTTVWPVPTHSSLNVALDGTAHPQALDLLDVLGRPVVHQNLAGRTTTTLPVEQLAPGTYVLRVTYDAGAVVRRIQVQ
jgi:uncharacterized delta-60 repeat protein